MDTASKTLNIAAGLESAKRQWVDEEAASHPYFALPALLYLKEHGVEGNDEMLARLAIAWPDRAQLARQLGADAATFASFYPPEEQPSTPDTDTTIDRFLDNYGHTSDKEIEALSNAIFNPTPDYADVLAAQERQEQGESEGQKTAGQPQSDEDRLISDFIEQSREKEREAAAAIPTAQHVEPEDTAEIAGQPIAEPASRDDSMLSESLAKMYISRGKYSKAIEIIESINLKFPEKSVYFADQIRFLRKLELNRKLSKNQK